ncbi:HNH endonuclease signature motif containing protein [Umezawaea sp. Da 62-37]|uniref:HNH endonuclease signature motif containing protein n=1 Tax=Umezawaea sp. Da 62-37 TaxID=3075927 RepID=UPI0028F6C753|nr:HNH endonuclease signature motif containing protein [Umezawaea sp. Da 62-37]WNV88407.1 HNH endonuclease signature motif containing protein [Umezawaea sp. Da 62-37]
MHATDDEGVGLDADRVESPVVARVDVGPRADLLVSFAGLSERGRDKSLALLWAIGQVAAGHDRLFPWAQFKVDAGRVLAEFGLEEPEAPYWGLGAESGLWEAGERAGFTSHVAERLGDRGFRGRVVDVLHREHLADVDFRALLTLVGLADHDLAPPSALDVLRSLVGKQLFTVTGKPNRIIRVDPDVVRVGTGRSEAGEPVRVAAVQKGLDLLREKGFVRIHPTADGLGHRSSFIGAVLATVPGAVASTGPAMVTMADPVDIPVSEGALFAVLDGKAVRKYRKEQVYLRRFLVGDRRQASCDLCGQEFPMGFLVAAHVKPRSLCTDEERNDLRNVAMLACGFGCDRLYEDGYLAVDEHGRVLAAPSTVELGSAVSDYLRRLEGLRCTAHRPGSEPYFAWHRDNVYRRGPATA